MLFRSRVPSWADREWEVAKERKFPGRFAASRTWERFSQRWRLRRLTLGKNRSTQFAPGARSAWEIYPAFRSSQNDLPSGVQRPGNGQTARQYEAECVESQLVARGSRHGAGATSWLYRYRRRKTRLGWSEDALRIAGLACAGRLAWTEATRDQ